VTYSSIRGLLDSNSNLISLASSPSGYYWHYQLSRPQPFHAIRLTPPLLENEPITLDKTPADLYRPAPPMKLVKLCDDTCPSAKNGKCDEGRFVPPRDKNRMNLPLANRSSTLTEVKCDIGTDCSDCGAWYGPAVEKEKPSDLLPISHLHSLHEDVLENMTIYVSHTLTLPPFLMAHTHPALDLDVSDSIDRAGLVEGGISQIFREVLHKQCVNEEGKRALVLDIGANFGYFSVYAALLGCRVIAWEPVPLFRSLIKYNLQLNNVSHLVELRGMILSDKDGEIKDMQVPTSGIWGTASVEGINRNPQGTYQKIQVVSERLDTVVKEDVLMMKLDVEGFEPYVFRGLKGFMYQNSRGTIKRKVDNIIMEYSPGIAKNMYPVIDVLEETPQMLATILSWGFKVGHLEDTYGKGGHVFWDHAIPALREVTIDHLKYDIEDARKFRNLTLGCPKSFDIANALEMQGCNLTPEDLHPKSFHSLFIYNTNIWAVSATSKSASLLRFNGEAALFGIDQDASRTWTSKAHPDMGLGSRMCGYLETKALVRNRCPCSSLNVDGKAIDERELKICKDSEGIINGIAKKGLLPFKP
jgi:FkbM family methyltransferase